VTLVLQGLALAPVIRRLGVASEADVRADTMRLHRLVAEAALAELRAADDVDPDARAAVVQQYESWLGYRRQVDGLLAGDVGGEGAGEQLRELLARGTEAEREAGVAADDVLFDVEARALRHR